MRSGARRLVRSTQNKFMYIDNSSTCRLVAVLVNLDQRERARLLAGLQRNAATKRTAPVERHPVDEEGYQLVVPRYRPSHRSRSRGGGGGGGGRPRLRAKSNPKEGYLCKFKKKNKKMKTKY